MSYMSYWHPLKRVYNAFYFCFIVYDMQKFATTTYTTTEFFFSQCIFTYLLCLLSTYLLSLPLLYFKIYHFTKHTHTFVKVNTHCTPPDIFIQYSCFCHLFKMFPHLFWVLKNALTHQSMFPSMLYTPVNVLRTS